MFGIIGGGVLLLAVFIAITIGLTSPNTATDKIRDIVIIFMGLEFLFIGLVLIILIVQIARLINLLQNEIKPILNSTNETVNTLKGTAEFIGDHLSEPIIKMNEYLAAFSELGKFFRAFRK